MPREGGQIFVGNLSLSADGILSIVNENYIVGVKEKISTCHSSWANNNTLIFTSDESGYVDLWKYTAVKASALFPETIPEHFG